ncbi:DegV family protein [Mycoplasmopsis columbina]|uniref:DegV family protein n=1 Tax=Mycoplasmopsis columbina TaxID=114881 RepID=UPI0004A6E208|nr:DegV family protein [Mycoplasmopsis columbina]VEU77172.1 DegV family protein [Mycoplasmopsis columbina]
MKYAIVVDSSSALTREDAQRLGWYYLPLHINIDGKEYRDGVDLTSKNLFEYYTKDAEVKTSSINPGEAYSLFEQLSKEYDKIIVYPISKYLSGTCQALTSLAAEFPKVRVVQSKQIVELILLDLFDFDLKMKNDPSKFDQYIEDIENKGFEYSITLIPKYNKYLVKGGRLHPSAALIAKMLSIVPLITFQNGQLLKEGTGRVFKKSVIKNIHSKLDVFDKDENSLLVYLHSGALEEDSKEFIEEFVNVFGEEPLVRYIAPVVAIHTGPESYVGVRIKINKELKNAFLTFLKQINN